MELRTQTSAAVFTVQLFSPSVYLTSNTVSPESDASFADLYSLPSSSWTAELLKLNFSKGLLA